MDSLPNGVVQYILSYINSAKDVAVCNCVSKRWQESLPYIRSIYFPRNSFESYNAMDISDNVVLNMISSFVHLEELVVYCQFSSIGLASWLSHTSQSLKHLELRMDNLVQQDSAQEIPSKLDCINAARNLSSLKLWGVLMNNSPRWDIFQDLRDLEIVGARIEDRSLSDALKACPNLTSLVLLGCEGLRSVTIELPCLEECKLDFYGSNCSLTLISPKIEILEMQGCSWIKVPETKCLKKLSISNGSGKVYTVEFGKLEALEFLSIRGVQWSWGAISKMLTMASEVKHLDMKIEFTGDFDNLQPFPEIDLVEFFNSHPKLHKFDIHGAMFAALCQKNSLKNVDTDFVIPCLEEVVITVRSPLNAEQKMNTLDSLIRYGTRLKTMVIKILQMKSNHSSSDDFFEDICKFSYLNPKIVRIE